MEKFKAKVIHGDGRGHKIGFPTVNLHLQNGELPEHGVYAVNLLYDDIVYPSVMHFGPRDTFGQHEDSLEVHILDFDDDLYDQVVEVEVLDKIREVQKFENVDALKKQIQMDIDFARTIFLL